MKNHINLSCSGEIIINFVYCNLFQTQPLIMPTMSSPIPPPPMNRHSSIDTSSSGSSSSSANHLENMTVTSTATVIVKKSSGAKIMARKSTRGSALPKFRGDRRVMGNEVSVKLPPVKKYRVSSGVRALAEISRYQISTELLIKRLPFQKLIKDIVKDQFGEWFRF